jgi:hypothetical protein
VRTIRLPKDLAAASLDELNREILQGTVALDWSQVEVASDEGLRRLLRGVDLVAGISSVSLRLENGAKPRRSRTTSSAVSRG